MGWTPEPDDHCEHSSGSFWSSVPVPGKKGFKFRCDDCGRWYISLDNEQVWRRVYNEEAADKSIRTGKVP